MFIKITGSPPSKKAKKVSLSAESYVSDLCPVEFLQCCPLLGTVTKERSKDASNTGSRITSGHHYSHHLGPENLRFPHQCAVFFTAISEMLHTYPHRRDYYSNLRTAKTAAGKGQ